MVCLNSIKIKFCDDPHQCMKIISSNFDCLRKGKILDPPWKDYPWSFYIQYAFT